jgi:hypothetical protein
MRTVAIIIWLSLMLVGTSYAAIGGVLDNNNGGAGTILVNSGSDVAGQDVGLWTAPADVPELKGETGEQGIQGETGATGATGVDGEGVHRQNAAGVGLDAILWQSPKEVFGVAAEYRYDERNDEHSAYVVGQLNLWKLLKKQ